MKRKQFIDAIITGARELKVPLNDVAAVNLYLYYRELERWNRRVNLVSRKQADWVRIHFLDSLVPVGMGLLKGAERIIDLGAGAGFPGLPLRIVLPGTSLTMAESSGKKSAFLRHVSRTLGLERADVAEGRFGELLGRGLSGEFDVAVSRAAAKPRKILEAATPFLAEGGRVLVYTSVHLAMEGPGTIHHYRLPGSDVPSVIWEVGASELRRPGFPEYLSS